MRTAAAEAVEARDPGVFRLRGENQQHPRRHPSHEMGGAQRVWGPQVRSHTEHTGKNSGAKVNTRAQADTLMHTHTGPGLLLLGV